MNSINAAQYLPLELALIVGDMDADLTVAVEDLRLAMLALPMNHRVLGMLSGLRTRLTGLLGEVNRAVVLVQGDAVLPCPRPMQLVAGALDWKLRQANDHSFDEEGKA